MKCKLATNPKHLTIFAINFFIMFSQGQLIFAICFLIAFIVVMIFSYRKDIATHRIFYKGNYKILIGFLIFIGLLFVIKVVLKH